MDFETMVKEAYEEILGFNKEAAEADYAEADYAEADYAEACAYEEAAIQILGGLGYLD